MGREGQGQRHSFAHDVVEPLRASREEARKGGRKVAKLDR